MTITGWLFDAYPVSSGIRVWLIDEEGNKHCVEYPFQPSFFLKLSVAEEAQLHRIIPRVPFNITTSRITKRELYSNTEYTVAEIFVANPLLYHKTVREMSNHFPFYKFYNADIKPGQMFYYSTGLFPLAYGKYCIEGGVLTSWDLYDAFDTVEYAIPPLSILSLTPSMTLLAPKYHRSFSLEICVDGRTTVLEEDSPQELLNNFNDYLEKYDPDIILTQYGDATLLPTLVHLARKYHVPLRLNRDAGASYTTTKAISFFTYGQIKHRDSTFELTGRWHIDKENSFMMHEAGLEGVYELARLSQTGVQRQARTSIGSALSSMQLSWAYRNNVLIPYKRPIKEAFKSFNTLLKADRGGLHFMPRIGYHEQVAELDFASMYPSLMHNNNISPETLDCNCCPDSKHTVPDIGYRICEKRTGLVPTTLKPILVKRARYKELKKAAATQELRTEYDHRQNALKWILVTCFGYLGFKKSRMGRIEAHEAVNAFSRCGLLRAKEIAEAEGFELIHAIVDCVWLKKNGATEKEYEQLCRRIEQEVGVKISLEGIYNWIVFPASKMDPEIPTATRYAGVYSNGEMKTRGIEVRRRDVPRFIRNVQSEMLDLLSTAKNMDEFRELIPESLDIARFHIQQLHGGKVNPLDLVMKKHISKVPSEYSKATMNAVVAQSLADVGIELSAGESIEYIIIDATGKKNPEKAKPLALYAYEDGYDMTKYTDMVLDAVETLLTPLGYSRKELQQLLCIGSHHTGTLSKNKKAATTISLQP